MRAVSRAAVHSYLQAQDPEGLPVDVGLERGVLHGGLRSVHLNLGLPPGVDYHPTAPLRVAQLAPPQEDVVAVERQSDAVGELLTVRRGVRRGEFDRLRE